MRKVYFVLLMGCSMTNEQKVEKLVKDYLKTKYNKPGNVFLGVAHRLDRPVFGLVVFAKTSKALARLNKMFANGEVHKTYWAIVNLSQASIKGADGRASAVETQLVGEGWRETTHWLVRNERQNKSYAYNHEVPRSKKAVLRYREIGRGDRYSLLEVNLLTGRHHQIRCQLAAIGFPIKGDLKYGAPRSNPDGSISLLSHQVEFVHPVSKTSISVISPLPDDNLWRAIAPVAD
jgi:23S rRNA pseudouridine1911/1915/1917 synthase